MKNVKVVCSVKKISCLDIVRVCALSVGFQNKKL